MIREKLRRLSAVLLGLMMAVLLAPGAFAVGGSAIITINKTGFTKDWTGMQVAAYQVLDQVSTTATNKQYEVTDNFAPFFSIDDEDKKLFDGAEDKKVQLTYEEDRNTLTFAPADSTAQGVLVSNDPLDETYPEADLISRLTESDDLATFYSWIEKYIEAEKQTEGDDWGTPATATAKDEPSLQITGLDEGYYALLFSKTPDGLSIKQGILVETGNTVTLKAEELPLTKVVQPADNKTGYAESATIELGEQLRYKITTKVPTLVDYSNLTKYELTDTLTQQIFTEDPATFSLQIGSTTAAKAPAEAGSGNYYQFTLGGETIATLKVDAYGSDAAAPNTQKITLAFVTEELATHQGEEVVFTYQAALTADAVTAVPNDVTLTYTNGPDTHTLTDQTLVYTYGIDVKKEFSDGRATDSAVIFKLFRADADGEKTGDAVELVQVGGTNTYGTYRMPGINEPATSTQTGELKLSTAGKLTITGLDAGTYWLEETGVPAGFTGSAPIKIVLTDTTGTGGVPDGNLDGGTTTATLVPTTGSEESIAVSVTQQSSSTVSLAGFSVLNQKGFTLPQTGGAGTWLFTVGGILLIAVAGILFVASRKKKNSD